MTHKFQKTSNCVGWYLKGVSLWIFVRGRGWYMPDCTLNKTYYIWIWTWWRHQMETLSALLALCAGNSPVTGEFPSQRPVTRSFDVFFDLRLNKRLSKQSWGWLFETPSRPLWCHCNDLNVFSPTVERGSIMTRTHIWSMIYVSLQTDFMEANHNGYLVISTGFGHLSLVTLLFMYLNRLIIKRVERYSAHAVNDSTRINDVSRNEVTIGLKMIWPRLASSHYLN